MTDGREPQAGGAAVAAHESFRRGEPNAEGWSVPIAKGRGWESAYRDRWRHDLVPGVVGAAGGLGGFFPPLVMGIVKSRRAATGSASW